MRNNPTELLSTLELWIAFLQKHDQFELLKQANITRMKLSALSNILKEEGSLSEGQVAVLNLCVKDYEYLQNMMFRLQYEPKNLLH